MAQNVRYVLLELVCAINIIIVGVVSDDDAGILHHILDIAKARNIRIWEGSVRVGPFGDLTHDGKSQFSKYKHTNILIQWQIKTLSKKSSSIYWMLLFLPENTLFSRYSPKDRDSKSKNNESRFQSLQSCYSGCLRV